MMYELFRKSSFDIPEYDPKARAQLAHDAGLFARAMRMKSQREADFARASALFPELTDDNKSAFDFRRKTLATVDIADFDPVDREIPDEVYQLLAEVRKQELFSQMYVLTSDRSGNGCVEYLLVGVVYDGAKKLRAFRMARWGDLEMPSWFELEERLRAARRPVAAAPLVYRAYEAEPTISVFLGRIFRFALFLVLLAIMYFVVVPFVSGTLNNMCDAGPCVPRYEMPLPPYQLP